MSDNETSVASSDLVSETKKRKFRGVVVSNKPYKTAVVRVERKKTHARYKKKIKWSKKYLIHDENNDLKLDDEVEFVESRPISKRKRFMFSRLITRRKDFDEK